MKMKNVSAEQIGAFICCYPLNILIIILFFRFFIQTVKYIIFLLKKERHSEEKNSLIDDGISALWYPSLVNGVIILFSDILSFERNYIFLLLIFSSMNTVIDFLLYTWLWRSKGIKFVLCCVVFLILIFCLYVTLYIT